MTGDTMLMNQLGRNGVIRKNNMYQNRLSRCPSTYKNMNACVSKSLFQLHSLFARNQSGSNEYLE